MNRSHLRRAAAVVALAFLPLLIEGCNKKLHLPSVATLRPVVRLTAAPIDTIGPDGRRARYIYHYKLNWVGYDPDGRVDHFLYTIDPPGSPGGGALGDSSECGRPRNRDTVWCSTRFNEKEIFFTASVPDSINPVDPRASDIHTFVIKAIDNSGLASAPVYRSFFSNTQAPTVQIEEPSPNGLFYALVTPFVSVRWHGDDPDGVFTQKPIKYKFKLFKDTDAVFGQVPPIRTEQFDLARQNGDSLRRFYAPTFAGWDSTTSDSTFATFTNLVPESRYLLVIVGFDEAGAYSPIFNRNSNMLQMLVTFAGNSGPTLTIFNEFFNYTYVSGGYNLDPSRYINLEVPAKQVVRFNWSAEAPNGSRMKQYRWALDISNLDDQTPRTDERTDTAHWSQFGLANTSASVGPFFTDKTHIFFIEAEDVNGLKSLGIVSFRVVVPTFNNDLLIVNDTRKLPDNTLSPDDLAYPLRPDSLQAPPSGWPSRAELDTFLFARGGVRWRMTPDGTLSQPGVFAGYRYDTVYTAAGGTNGFVTLDTLGRYKHVVWITDPGAAAGINSVLGFGVLRQMSERGRANTLAAYVTLGGYLWMVGSTMQATLLPWNVSNNDRDSPPDVLKFSITPTPGRPAELGAGKMLYDQAHWRTDAWAFSSITAFPHKSVRAVGGYPTRSDPRWGVVRAPDYSQLPPRMGRKNRVDDVTPPFRSLSSFLSAGNIANLEFLTAASATTVFQNAILEDTSNDPDNPHLVSMLDTLMIAPLSFNPTTTFPLENEDLSQGGRFYHSYPVMTYYHGLDNPPFVMTGFDLWTYTRRDIVKVIDFVLQQVWGLPKEPIVAPARVGPPVARAGR